MPPFPLLSPRLVFHATPLFLRVPFFFHSCEGVPSFHLTLSIKKYPPPLPLSTPPLTPQMIHTDLKPENILLEKPDQAPSSGIGDGWAICDLGSASFFSTNPDQDLIQTRPYRAPEVVLGCPWSYGVDMFSMGCIFYELKTGHKLFDAMNDEQQLIMFEKRLGKIPSWLVRTAHPKHRRQFFDASDRLVHSPSVFSNPYGKSASTKRSLTEEFASEPEFLDFLRQCLHYDPVVRMRADEVAHHPWVKKFFNPTSQDGLLRKLPQSAYTAGVIRTPGQSMLKGDAPLSREDKERLMSSASAAAAPSNPDSRSGSGQQGGVPRIPSTSSLQELRRKEAEAAHHQAAAAAGASALRHPHLAPAAGMPSRSLPGSVPASSAMRAPGGVPLRGPPMMAPGRPMPPREPSHYLTSSQAYGSSVRGYNPHRAIPSPNLPGFPTAGRPYLTPPTF